MCAMMVARAGFSVDEAKAEVSISNRAVRPDGVKSSP